MLLRQFFSGLRFIHQGFEFFQLLINGIQGFPVLWLSVVD